jgi:hypothetical protein
MPSEYEFSVGAGRKSIGIAQACVAQNLIGLTTPDYKYGPNGKNARENVPVIRGQATDLRLLLMQHVGSKLTGDASKVK